MCGIVGAVAERNICHILLEGLKRLEYRGYDSAGLTLVHEQQLKRERQVGKVKALADVIDANVDQFEGHLGIAHTRWATHGIPAKHNAHPHISEQVAVVHNGIVENYETFKQELTDKGYQFHSQTDTEVVAHLIHDAYQTTNDLLEAVSQVVPRLHGAFALGVVHASVPDEIIAVRLGAPLVVGVGIGENFIASDQLALLPVTNRFVYLDEGDIARISRQKIDIRSADGTPVNRPIKELDAKQHNADKGAFKHYMLKEIYEQPDAVNRTLEIGASPKGLHDDFLQPHHTALAQVKYIQILACGTSFHAGMVAKYWFEQLTRLPCAVEVASEFRYRHPVVLDNTLLVCISQSGETADTLSALRLVTKQRECGDLANLLTLALCNVPTSTMVRETDICLPTKAGVEIGVASTKAFTAQLVALMLLVLKLGQLQQRLTEAQQQRIIDEMFKLSANLYQTLALDEAIKPWCSLFEDKTSTLFLGRGIEFPIALEGALKLKEISYIHAEGYAAGELKHGPLALVDKHMPVVVVAPNDDMIDKLKANIQEVHARNGELLVFAAADSNIQPQEGIHVIQVPAVDPLLAPIVYSVPMQLLSYHVAVSRGTDVDQPRNLAKSVTVE